MDDMNASNNLAENSAKPIMNEKPKTAERKASFFDEIKGFLWLLIAVLMFHSFVAKPFYIPSISMMPTLLVGDRLVVAKYPYGWSYVSPTIPNPAAIFRWGILRQEEDSLAFILPEKEGRIWGSSPERGDIVILTHPENKQDYIKRVIGLPGETISVKNGQIFINGKAIQQEAQPSMELPVDDNNDCNAIDFPNALRRDENGTLHCFVSIVREKLPNGKYWDTIDARDSQSDNVRPYHIPKGQYYLMGDNRDNSADSRAPWPNGLGGAVKWENIGGRASFITFSLDGTTSINPKTWYTSLRSNRAGNSLRAKKEEQSE